MKAFWSVISQPASSCYFQHWTWAHDCKVVSLSPKILFLIRTGAHSITANNVKFCSIYRNLLPQKAHASCIHDNHNLRFHYIWEWAGTTPHFQMPNRARHFVGKHNKPPSGRGLAEDSSVEDSKFRY